MDLQSFLQTEFVTIAALPYLQVPSVGLECLISISEVLPRRNQNTGRPPLTLLAAALEFIHRYVYDITPYIPARLFCYRITLQYLASTCEGIDSFALYQNVRLTSSNLVKTNKLLSI